MTALAKVAKRSRRSERIETLRERGYSEQEIAETERLDRHNLWMVLVTLAALLLAAGLYSWHIFSGPSNEAEGGAASGSEDEGGSLMVGSTVADFFRPKPAQDDEEEEEAPTEVAKPRAPSGPGKAAETKTPSEPFILLGPAPVQTSKAPTYDGPDKAAVRRTTVRALKSGKARIWKHDDQRGYVLVSGPTTYSDRTCRQVSYTLIPEVGDQLASPPVQWCEIKRGEWAEDPYTER